MKLSNVNKLFLLFITVIILVISTLFFRANGKIEAVSTNQQGLQNIRNILIADQQTLRVNLLRSLDPQMKNTQGEILWNAKKQTGILLLHGLPKQDVREKYQLWIYDLKRNNNDPTLAANFYGSRTETSNSEPYIVAIRPTEIVQKAFKFVVTKSSVTTNKFDQAETLLFAQP